MKNRYRGLSRRQIEEERNAIQKRRPSLTNQITRAASNVAKIGAALYIGRHTISKLADSGILEQAGNYLLAGSDAVSDYISRASLKDLSMDQSKEVFKKSLLQYKSKEAGSYLNQTPELIRILKNKELRLSSDRASGSVSQEIEKALQERYILDAEKTYQDLNKHFDEEIIKRLSINREESRNFLNLKELSVQEVLDKYKSGDTSLITEEHFNLINRFEESLKRSGISISLSDLRFDNRLFLSSSGQLQDYRSLSEFGDRTLKWWSSTMIGSIGRFNAILEKKNTPFSVLIGGEKDHGRHPILRYYEDAKRLLDKEDVSFRSRTLQNTYLAIGERVVNLYDSSEPYLEGINIISGQKGTMANLLKNYDRTHPISDEPKGFWGKTAKFLKLDELLDIGYQEDPSRISKAYRWLDKETQDTYIPNIIEKIRKGQNISFGQFVNLESFLNQEAPGFDQKVFDILSDLFDDDNPLKNINISTTRKGIQTAINIADSADFEGLNQNLSFKSFVDNIRLDPDGFAISRTADKRIKQNLSDLLINNLSGNQIKNSLELALEDNIITKSQYENALNTMSRSLFKRTNVRLISDLKNIKNIYSENFSWVDQLIDNQPMKELQSLFNEDINPDFNESLNKMIKSGSSLFGKRTALGADLKSLQGTGSQYTVVSKSKLVESSLEMVKNINLETIEKVTSHLPELWADHASMYNVTSATSFVYGFGDRLSGLLSNVGLGLSSKSKDSVLGLYSGIFAKRMLAGYGLYKAAQYLDYETENITGMSAKKRWTRAKAQARIEGAETFDKLGITDNLKQIHRVMPGLDKLSHLPFIGWTFEEPRSAPELLDYYIHGSQPVRKGRWWRLGSTTPYIGESTSYYLPNEYILGTTDWKFTDTLYGSKDEYWSRSWIPTPRYPLSPLKALSDPYWLERKNYEDRPYPLTGELFESGMPGGPILNATIGEMIKPVRPMHRKELRDYNEEIKRTGRERTRTLPQGPAYGVIGSGTITPQSFMPVFPDFLGANISENPYQALMSSDSQGVPSGFYGYASNLSIQKSKDKELYANMPSGFIPLKAMYGSAGQDANINANIPSNIVGIPSNFGMPFYINKESSTSQDIVTSLNQAIISKNQNPFGASLNLKHTTPTFEASDMFMPNDPAYRFSSMRWSSVKLAGIYGFTFDTLTGGDPYKHRTMVASSADMYTFGNTIAEANVGGLTGDLSEVFRRFLPPRSSTIKKWNPIRNTMPTWLPGPEAYEDFLHGDPYRIPHGEIRLPGEAYESVHTLHSDPWFGKYGALERLKILGDVAPYSDQYKIYRETVRNMLQSGMLPSEWESQYQTILDQVRERKERYELQPYQFKQAYNIERISVQITDIIDNNTVLTDMFPNNPIDLAGINISKNINLEDYIYPGKNVELIISKEESTRINDDSLKTISGTLIVDGENLNKKLLDSGLAGETSELNPASVWAKYTPTEISTGSGWETISHLNVPVIHNRFLSIHSPLEYYKRKMIYGKEHQSWAHPIRDYIRPTLDSYASKNPITASGLGAISGAIVGSVFLGGGKRTLASAGIGAAMSGLSSFYAIGHGILTGEKWIPKRRRDQHKIEEYFDILKYVKYKGLYERSADLALRKEGVRINKILNKLQKENKENVIRVSNLEEERRNLLIKDRHYYKDRIQEINQEIYELTQGKETIPLGKYTLQAIQYRAEYESTIYGLDLDTASDEMIFKALPNKDKQFYEHFVNETDPKKRRQILSMIPKHQRRIYQSKWNMKTDKKPKLDTYFKTHKMPDRNWEGWDPSLDLSYFKVKTVKNEALDMTPFDVWDSDLDVSNRMALPLLQPFTKDNYVTMKKNLNSALKGVGLRNVIIDIVESDQEGVMVEFNIAQDRQHELESVMSKILMGGIA